MSQIDAVSKIAAALDVRIRKARPDFFQVVRGLVERFELFGIDERLDLAGYDSSDSAFESDAAGNVTSLYMKVDESAAVDRAADQIAALTKLQFLAIDGAKATLTMASALATLPDLRLLAVSLPELGTEILSLLSAAKSLQGILFINYSAGLDVSPLLAMKSLSAVGFIDGGELVNAAALAHLPSLRHLAVTGESFPKNVALPSQIETLLFNDGPPAEVLNTVLDIPGLQSLLMADIAVPPPFIARLTGLRTLNVKYTADSLEPLLGLHNIESLQLSGTQLKDLNGLRDLEKLKRFSIRDGKTTDVSALRDVARLTFLDLSENPIERMPDQWTMPDLLHLEWAGGPTAPLRSADFLAGCQALESLNLGGHNLTDLSFVRGLGHLRELNVRNNSLTSVEPLSLLPNLTTLNVEGNRITSVEPLARVSTLTRLVASRNPIRDVRPLASLGRLEDLKLNHVGITDLDFVKRLRNLFRLEVADNQITSIEPLLSLGFIARADLSRNAIRSCSRETVQGLRSLETLDLSGNPIEGIDRELFEGSGKRTLKSLRDYYRALSRGSVRHDQVKLLLVGNGRVGKTSIVNRLVDDKFDQGQPSTHGIQLRRWSLEHGADQQLGDRPLQIDVWDFGGQDIYHATHRLFMRTRALFLVVWDKTTENAPYSIDEFGERYENFRLPYWIDYIKALAGSPVLIVQNKVDTVADRDRAYGLELEKGYPPPNGIIDYVYVSAKKSEANGFDTLVDSIKGALGQLGSIGYELPAQWVEVRDRLAAMEHRYIDYAEYHALCAEVGMHGNEHMSLIGFLHQSGAVFYQPNNFGERLILDQRWAIEAVYALFDRRGAAYRDLRAAGRNGLPLEMLKRQVWRNFSEDEHRLLLEFMQSCELCFEFSPGRYYVPQLLPDEKPPRVAVRWDDPTPNCLRITYAFLHRAIIDRFLVRAGLLGVDVEPEIWKNGIIIYDSHTDSEAMVEAFPAEGRILVQARGPAAVPLLCKIRLEFDALHESFPATFSVSADAGERFVDLEELRKHVDAGATTVLSTNNALVEVAPLVGFLADSGGRLPKGRVRPSGRVVSGVASSVSAARQSSSATPSKPETFISYAWGDAAEQGEHRDAVVDRLYDELLRRQYAVIRDKQDLGYRQLISEFMRRIGRGKLVVTVISDKYLKSPHCMYELLEIYRNGGFTDRVFPLVLRDAKLYSLADRLGYVQHWKQEKDKIEGLIRDIGLAAFSSDGTFKEYDTYYREVFNNIDKLMGILADWNALTPQVLEEDNFERLIAAIDARIAAG